MEAVFGIVMGMVLFMHACQMFGVSDRRTTGVVGLVGALTIAASVLSRSIPRLTAIDIEAMAAVWFVWVMYCGLVAATGLWGVDTRGFGYWAILGLVASLNEFAYSALVRHPKGVAQGLVLAVAFAVLFAYLGLRREALRPLAAWVFLGASVVFLLLSTLVLFGIPGLL